MKGGEKPYLSNMGAVTGFRPVTMVLQMAAKRSKKGENAREGCPIIRSGRIETPKGGGGSGLEEYLSSGLIGNLGGRSDLAHRQ